MLMSSKFRPLVFCFVVVSVVICGYKLFAIVYND